MARRRLLWVKVGIATVLAAALLSTLAFLVMPRSQTQEKRERIKVGMALSDASDILGRDSCVWDKAGGQFGVFTSYFEFPDGIVSVHTSGDRVVGCEFTPNPPLWDRIRLLFQ